MPFDTSDGLDGDPAVGLWILYCLQTINISVVSVSHSGSAGRRIRWVCLKAALPGRSRWCLPTVDSWKEVVYPHHLMDRVHLVQQQRQLRIAGDLCIFNIGTVEVGLFKALTQLILVAHGGNATVDAAGAESDKNLALAAKCTQHLYVFCIADAALDDADITLTDPLDIGDRCAVELHQLGQINDALVDIEDRHMAAETAGEGGGGDFDFIGHLTPPRAGLHRPPG